MDINTLINIGGFLLLISGAVLAWRTFFYGRRKTDAETENTLALTVANLGVEVARLTKDLDEERQKRRALEDEFEAMKDEHAMLKQLNASMRKGIKVLTKQLTASGIKPEYSLPD